MAGLVQGEGGVGAPWTKGVGSDILSDGEHVAKGGRSMAEAFFRPGVAIWGLVRAVDAGAVLDESGKGDDVAVADGTRGVGAVIVLPDAFLGICSSNNGSDGAGLDRCQALSGIEGACSAA